MYEIARKCSEFAYYSKHDVEAQWEPYLVETIWQEIQQYRNFFNFVLPTSE